jgi:tetratricopeptide (TPR) repeat protein/predicted Ser/Thr protein kinase
MIADRISHYKVVAKLGQGGMGEVYLAEDTSLGRRVALKVLPEDRQQDPVARQRLLREAKAAAALDQPYICSIHEVDEADGLTFIVMEYVEGETLRQRLARSLLGIDEVLRLGGEVAEALEDAHQKGIVHRDLKPANIMLTRKGHAKVMDFGLAKQSAAPEGESGAIRTATALTSAGVAVGTLTYMSPEQLKGDRVDGRSDIFALGIVLYEALTGVHPFARPRDMETASAILHDSLPPLARYARGMPDLLEHVVAKMLAKDPDERYQSAHEVRTDLAQIVRDRLSGSAGAPLRAVAPRRAWRRWLIPAAVAVVAVGAWWGLAGYLRLPATALAFNERDWITIADFDNRTGDPVFDRSLDTAMAVSIQQSKYVNVFPRSRVQQTLARMRRPETARFDENLAREVAVREGVKAVLVCRISRVGEEYSLTAELVDPNAQVVVSSQAVRAAGRNGVLGALDELAQQTREKLGESLSSIANQRVGLPRATTASLEALKAFAESRRARGQTVQQLLKQAIGLDPDFAMAHADVGVNYYIGNNRQAGEEHFKKALSLLDRLTQRERLWITAVVEDWRGNRQQGIENYRTYLSQYPDDPRAWFRLGYTCMITQQYESAIDAFEHALKIDPSESAAHVNIATCYNSMRQNEKALASYQRAFALDKENLTGPFVNSEYGFLLVRMGRLDEARQTFEKMLAVGTPEKTARGHRSLALLAMYRGRYDEAIRELNEAVSINKTNGYQLSELRDRLFLVNALRTKGATAAVQRELNAVQQVLTQFKPGVSWLEMAGRSFARNGRTAEAAALLKVASTRLGDLVVSSAVNQSDRHDRATYEVLRGEVDLAQKRYVAAVAAFEEAERLSAETATESLALAESQRGNLDRAVEWYERLLSQDALGTEQQEPWLLAQYQLGRIHEQKKDPARAVKAYDTFLTIWKDADPDLPAVADAKRRLAKLRETP